MNEIMYPKLGRSEPRGVLHAVKAETVTRWEGPESHCGRAVRETIARTNGRETRCAGCRSALGLADLRGRA